MVQLILVDVWAEFDILKEPFKVVCLFVAVVGLRFPL